MKKFLLIVGMILIIGMLAFNSASATDTNDYVLNNVSDINMNVEIIDQQNVRSIEDSTIDDNTKDFNNDINTLNNQTTTNNDINTLNNQTTTNNDINTLNNQTTINNDINTLNNQTTINNDSNILNNQTTINNDSNILNNQTTINNDSNILNLENDPSFIEQLSNLTIDGCISRIAGSGGGMNSGTGAALSETGEDAIRFLQDLGFFDKMSYWMVKVFVKIYEKVNGEMTDEQAEALVNYLAFREYNLKEEVIMPWLHDILNNIHDVTSTISSIWHWIF